MVRINQCSIRRAWITRIQNSWRRVRKHRRLRSRSEKSDDFIVDIVLWAVVFVAYPKVQSKPREHLKCILRKVVLRRRSDRVYGVRELEEVPGESTDEIGRGIACERTTGQRPALCPAKREAAVGEEVKVEIILHTPDIRSKFPFMPAMRNRYGVMKLIGHVMERGRPLRGGAKIETRRKDDGRGGS